MSPQLLRAVHKFHTRVQRGTVWETDLGELQKYYMTKMYM
jgi:hypothetical protein